MLSIAKMGAGQELYYTALAAQNYYLEGGEPLGHWWGRGAEKLRLHGIVEEKDLTATLRGFDRDGEGLVQNAGKPNRCPGWDLTFSCPKSVSVLWSQAEHETRQQIQAAHKAACTAALSYLESMAGYSRTGKGGYEQKAAGLAVAMFEHATSRALDPDLHTHCLVANLGVADDGRTRALDSRHLFRHKMAAGALYRVQLAHELETRLGLEVERKRTWFELKGVPKTLCDFFSKRRLEILDALGKFGLETAAAAAVAALSTRRPKDLVPPRAELFEQRWKAPAQEHGFSAAQARSLLGHKREIDRNAAYRGALVNSIETLTKSESHFAKRDIVRRMMEASQGTGLDVTHVLGWLDHDLEHSGKFVKLADRDGELRYTTPEMLALEKKLLESAESHKHDRRVVSASTVDWAVANSRALNGGFSLNAEQTQAVRHLTETAGRIKILSGLAGTGKTSTLRVCREAWEQEDYTVIGAAVAGKAADELRQGAGIESSTLKLLEMRMHPELRYRMRHHAEQLLRAARKKVTWKLESLRFNDKTILVIDEAGMVGTSQMARVVGDVLAQGGKVVLVGDAKQLQAIEAGSPFAALGKRLGQATLTQITRQRAEEDRTVVRDLLKGEALKALTGLAQRDRLQVSANPIRELVARWSQENRNGLKGVLALAATHQEVDELNQRLQRSRVNSGHVKTNKSVKLQQDYVFVGDRVLFKANSSEIGAKNGHLGTVTGINTLTKSLAVTLDEGRRVHVSLSRYKHKHGDEKGRIALELGYAATTHAAQGTTLEDAYLLLGGSMQHREMSYVQFSRARGRTFAFIDEQAAGPELKEIATSMARSRTKDLAHDVLLDAAPRQQILARA